MRKMQARSVTKGIRLAARGFSLAFVGWMGGLVLLACELAHVSYVVDWPSSLVVALVLGLGSVLFWELDTHQSTHSEQAGQRQWLKLLLVERQEVESALAQLRSLHSEVTALIHQSDQPRLHQIWRDVVLRTHSAESEYIRDPLESALSMQATQNQGLDELTQQLRSLQIAFSHGTHQTQLIYQLHDAMTALQPLVSDSKKAWTILSRVCEEHQAHSRSLESLPDQQFEMWRQTLRSLQKQLRTVENSLLLGLGENLTTTRSSPDLMNRFEPKGPA